MQEATVPSQGLVQLDPKFPLLDLRHRQRFLWIILPGKQAQKRAHHITGDHTNKGVKQKTHGGVGAYPPNGHGAGGQPTQGPICVASFIEQAQQEYTAKPPGEKTQKTVELVPERFDPRIGHP